MKSLGAKFSDKQLAEIKELSVGIDIAISKISRAALRLGIIQISNMAIKDEDKAKDLVLVNDARSK